MSPIEVKTVKMGIGKQIIYPIRFNGYELPGLEVEFELPDGVTLEEAHASMLARLRAIQSDAAKSAQEDWERNVGRARRSAAGMDEG